MPVSQIIPSLPSPRVHKTVLYICVSFAAKKANFNKWQTSKNNDNTPHLWFKKKKKGMNKSVTNAMGAWGGMDQVAGMSGQTPAKKTCD